MFDKLSANFFVIADQILICYTILQTNLHTGIIPIYIILKTE